MGNGEKKKENQTEEALEGGTMTAEETIIKVLASQYSKTIKDPMWSFDDLQAEGLLTWSSLLTETTNGSDFSSLLFIAVKNRFTDIYRWERMKKRSAIKVPLYVLEKEQELRNVGYRYVELESDAQEVVKILLETPQELLDLGNGNGVTKESVTKYLVRHRGWTHYEVNKFWRQL